MVNIGFFSSSKDSLKNKYNDDIIKLLEKIKNRTKIHNAVYGGGKTGIMGIVYDVFKDNIISHNLEKWKVSDNENIHPDMLARQRAIIESSDIFIVLPGGVGTVSELFDCIMMNDTEQFNKPIIIYNIDNYYDELYNFLGKLYNIGASKKSNILYCNDNIDDIINIINLHFQEVH